MCLKMVCIPVTSITHLMLWRLVDDHISANVQILASSIHSSKHLMLILLWSAPHSSLSCLFNAAIHMSITVALSIQQLISTQEGRLHCLWTSMSAELLHMVCRFLSSCYIMCSIWEGHFFSPELFSSSFVFVLPLHASLFVLLSIRWGMKGTVICCITGVLDLG